MKAGDVVWFRKENASYFRQYKVLSETARSFVCVPMEKDFEKYIASEWWVKQAGVKVPKNGKGFNIAEEGMAKLNNWAMEHRYQISELVGRCYEPAILLAISKLVGFKQPEDIING